MRKLIICILASVAAISYAANEEASFKEMTEQKIIKPYRCSYELEENIAPYEDEAYRGKTEKIIQQSLKVFASDAKSAVQLAAGLATIQAKTGKWLTAKLNTIVCKGGRS